MLVLKIRIALITYFDGSNGINGISEYCNNLVISLRKYYGNKVSISLIGPSKFVYPKRNLGFIKFTKIVRKFLSENSNKFDIIHATSGAGFLLKRLDIETIHHLDPFLSFSFLHSIPSIISIFRAKNRIAVSNLTKLNFTRFRINNISVINNGIDTNFYKFKKRELKNIKAIFVGSLTKRKQPFLLLEWLKLNPNVSLTILGKGEEYKKLLQKVNHENLNDKVEFLVGDQQKHRDLLYAHNLFLFPSKLEGFGLAVVEAVSTGIPFLAFDTGIFNLLAIKKGGIVVKTISEFLDINASKILDCYSGIQEASKFIDSNFSSRIMSKSYYEKYKDIIKSRTFSKSY